VQLLQKLLPCIQLVEGREQLAGVGVHLAVGHGGHHAGCGAHPVSCLLSDAGALYHHLPELRHTIKLVNGDGGQGRGDGGPVGQPGDKAGLFHLKYAVRKQCCANYMQTKSDLLSFLKLINEILQLVGGLKNTSLFLEQLKMVLKLLL
jgi:hypothetical protein